MNCLKYITISLSALCCLFMASCDLHQFPEQKPEDISFVLHLDYDTEMPLYKVVEYTDPVNTKSATSLLDVRYLVNVYDGEDENSQDILKSFTFTKDDVSVLDNSVTLTLPEGNYRFMVWSDYVQQGDEEDHHYATERFEYISLPDGTHPGSTDSRDAFRGSASAVVSKESTEATVDMTRPMAKFNFVSTDIKDFISRLEKAGKVRSSGDTNLEDYTVVFRYNGFMPFAYNLYTGKPTDSRTDVSFESKLSLLNENEAEMGFDYVFVNGNESEVSIAIEIYDVDGTLLSRFKPVNVPLMRSKLTTVKANFLTTSAGGGVAVDPAYDGNHNIVFN